jgi:hypothetical protein
MMRAMALTARTPRFSDRHDASFGDLFALVAQMRLREAALLLAEIFPASDEDSVALALIKGRLKHAAGDSIACEGTFDGIRKEFVSEIDKIAEAIRCISLAVSSAYGAYG